MQFVDAFLDKIWKNRQKILFALFVLAILFRIFSIMVVPEPTYNDSVYHLEVAEQLMNGAPITKEMPPFLYHLILAGFFGATALPMIWPFVKIIPIVVTLVTIVLAYLLFKKMFPKNYLLPTLLFVVCPWSIRIGSVNMVDMFSTFAVTFFAFSLYNFVVSKKKKEEKIYLVSTLGSFVIMAFSKMNVVFILPVLVLGFAFVSFKKYGLPKAVVLGLVALLLSVSFIFVSLNAPASESALLVGDTSSIRGIPIPRLDLITPQFFPVSFAAMFDFPAASSFTSLPILNMLPYWPVMILFIILMLPIGYVIVKGIAISANPVKKIKTMSVNEAFVLTALLGFLIAFYPATTIIRQDMIYMRYILPIIIFISVLFGVAFERLGDKMKKIVLVSIIIFSLYAFAMTSVSAVYYNQVQQKNAPLYEFINSSTEFDSLISSHNARALRYYTNKEIIQLHTGATDVDSLIANYNVRHVPLTCYNEDIPEKVLDIFSSEKTEIIFEEGCTKLVQINE